MFDIDKVDIDTSGVFVPRRLEGREVQLKKELFKELKKRCKVNSDELIFKGDINSENYSLLEELFSGLYSKLLLTVDGSVYVGETSFVINKITGYHFCKCNFPSRHNRMKEYEELCKVRELFFLQNNNT